ncbi:SH3 domain-containing protein [Jiella pelagia]|uniref:SH3 domain-containing protein n=1 Tax=Jiella pelagia TaxID=2986949 RepID=A0ABY7C056_9HYPH|nr:SH3 domain-containing protein [Jiella pelagia]WAP69408.1 SH3 domain-containing protein [Jiella pelagia]
MPMWRIFAAASLVIAAGSIAPASAQGFAPACQNLVKELCGRVSVGRCFQDESLWASVNPQCSGDIQTMIEMEREAGEQQTEDRNTRSRGNERPTRRQQAAEIQRGLSYGGILRAGPGMDYAKLGSLQPDDDINILEDTGIWFDEYKWFKVDSPIGVGYHWGGIFCTEGRAPEGVLSSCAEDISGGGPQPAPTAGPDESADAAEYVRTTFYTDEMLTEGLSPDNEGFFTNPAVDVIHANNGPGGSCIDVNPFVDAQDYDITEIKRTLKLNASRAANGQMLVEADFRNFGERKSIVWTLVGSSGFWQVSDIEGPETGSRLGAIRCP